MAANLVKHVKQKTPKKLWKKNFLKFKSTRNPKQAECSKGRKISLVT